MQIGGTPYTWILDSSLPGVQFGDFNSVLLIIIGVIANGSVALIALILVVILAWNYLKLLLEAAERYVVLGILVFTAPLAFDFLVDRFQLCLLGFQVSFQRIDVRSDG